MERIAGRHVDAVRSFVEKRTLELRRVGWTDRREAILHRSLSIGLHREADRLRTPGWREQILPPRLAEISRLLGPCSAPARLEPIVRLRASQWRRAMTEMLERLDQDWPSLVAHFRLHPASAIASVSGPLGDLHNGGRSVFRIGFTDGQALIYKPRSVLPESVFAHLVRYLSESGCEPVLTACDVLPRGGYGWVRYVQSALCESLDEVERYYERQGAYAMVFFVLCGGDLIADNVIVCGSHPVWVDTECICVPELVPKSIIPGLPDWMSDSVLSTSLLFHGNRQGVRQASIAGVSVSCMRDRSLVFGADDTLRPRFARAVTRGFTTHYDWWLARRERLTLQREPLSVCREMRVRVIPRNTALYLALGDLLLSAPGQERPSVRREVEAALRDGDNRGAVGPTAFVNAELASLERGDVPYWSVGSGSRELRESNRRGVLKCVTRTGLERVEQRIARLSERDLERQLWLIEGFLGIRMTA